MMIFTFNRQLTADLRKAVIIALKEYLGDFKAEFDIERVEVYIEINPDKPTPAYFFSGHEELIERFNQHKSQEPPEENWEDRDN